MNRNSLGSCRGAMSRLAGLLFLLAVGLPAYALDLGVQGTVWPIIEEDIRAQLVAAVAKTDWAPVQDEVKKSAESYLERLPKRKLPVSEKTQTSWFDPSIELTSDIQAPVKDEASSYQWTVLFPKGPRVNPLKNYRPVTAMLFFDGSDEQQVAFVEQVLREEPNRIIPVEAGSGDLNTLNTRLDRPVFYGNEAIINRFGVKYLPTLMYPGQEANQLLIGLTSYGLPFNPAEVSAVWPPPRATHEKTAP
jgi:conjugal transfer pilus assembly protein TraW